MSTVSSTINTRTAQIPQPTIRPLKPWRDLGDLVPTGFQDPLMNILTYLPETRAARRASKYMSAAYERAIHEYEMKMHGTKSWGDYSSDEPTPFLVLDCGTKTVKVGYGGDDAPRSCFPNVFGRPKQTNFMMGGFKDFYVGDDCQMRRGILRLSHPMERARIVDWDGIEKVWDYTFKSELRVEAEDHDVLYAESQLPCSPSADDKKRSKLLEVMMETFNVKSLTLQHESVLSLMASGKMSGVSVDLGYNTIRVTPVYQGIPLIVSDDGSKIPSGQVDSSNGLATELNFGSQDLVEYTMKTMTEDGFTFTGASERDIVRCIMEKMCGVDPVCERVLNIRTQRQQDQSSFVSKIPEQYDYFEFPEDSDTGTYGSDFSSIQTRGKVGEFELPDGQILSITAPRTLVPEALFHPCSLLGLDCSGIHKAIATTLRCVKDRNLADECLWGNIHLFGGMSRFQNLDIRLKAELQREVGSISTDPSSQNEGKVVDVFRAPESKYSTWIGGSILSCLSSIEEICPAILRDEYREYGAARCLEKRRRYAP